MCRVPNGFSFVYRRSADMGTTNHQGFRMLCRLVLETPVQKRLFGEQSHAKGLEKEHPQGLGRQSEFLPSDVMFPFSKRIADELLAIPLALNFIASGE